MFGVVIDITERKQAEEALKQSEERLRAIIETTPECVKIVASDGTLLHMNSAGLDMVGVDCAEMAVGRSIYDVIAAEHRERFVEFNGRICAGAKEALEFDIIDMNGVRHHMESHAAPLRDVDGTTVHLAVTRDVTARKLAEDAFANGKRNFGVWPIRCHILYGWQIPMGISFGTTNVGANIPAHPEMTWKASAGSGSTILNFFRRS